MGQPLGQPRWAIQPDRLQIKALPAQDPSHMGYGPWAPGPWAGPGIWG